MKKKIYSLILVAALSGFSVRADDQPTINQGAEQGSKSQNAGQMMNMIASAALMAACLAPKPPQMSLCAMGALAAMQAANQGSAANQSDATFDASKYGVDNNLDTTLKAGDDGLGTAAFTDPKINEGLGKLKEAGYKVDENGVTTPDGKFQPASAFNSPSSMVAAGISENEAKAAAEVLSKLNGTTDGARVSAMAVDGGAGGGGYGGGADMGDLEPMTFAKLSNPFSVQDRKKMAAGKSVLVGGEPIGVRSDNIFDMVHRAYQKKRQRQIFEEGLLRIPASQSRNGL